MAKHDYYELLEVERTVNTAELKSAYRKLALKYHPDRNPDNKEAEDRFKQISEAYNILSDERKRQVYDQYGHAGLEGGGGFGGGFSSADDIFSAFGDIFEDFFGGSTGRRGGGNRARRGADLQTEVEIEFLDACFGTKKDITVNKRVTCETCHGSGAKAGSSPEACTYCKGRGQVQMQQGFFTISPACPQCQGQGQVIKNKCGDCRGSGVLQKERKLNLKIPAGVGDGTRLLMNGEGEAGQNSGPAGDLYVYIRVKEHETFQREQDHILSEVKIPFPFLALGHDLQIPTIDGEDVIKIKAGTQSGEVMRLPGKGVANVRTGKRGDHLVHIQAVTPDQLSAEQKDLMQKLADTMGGEQKKAAPKKKRKGIFS